MLTCVTKLEETWRSYIDPRLIGCTKAIRGEHIYPHDLGKTLEELENASKPKITVELKFIIQDLVEFKVRTNHFDKEDWRQLLLAVEDPNDECSLEVDRDLYTYIGAQKDGKVKFMSGYFEVLLSKQVCLNAFREAQEKLDKYHDPEVYAYHTQLVHNSNGRDWFIVYPREMLSSSKDLCED